VIAKQETPEVTAIDLFCGAGGLSFGLKSAGIKVLAGIDNDPVCEYPYTENVKARFIEQSVFDVTGKQLTEYWGNANIRLLAGCAPCQPFSTQRKGVEVQSDPRWPLIDEFARLIRETMPDFVTMENVPGVIRSPIFGRFVSTLSQDLNYNVDFSVIDASQYGLPQRRRRMVLVAGYGKLHPLIPKPNGQKTITVGMAIESLPELPAGGYCHADPLHRAQQCESSKNPFVKTRRYLARLAK